MMVLSVSMQCQSYCAMMANLSLVHIIIGTCRVRRYDIHTVLFIRTGLSGKFVITFRFLFAWRYILDTSKFYLTVGTR
jgi:hypothetical protein